MKQITGFSNYSITENGRVYSIKKNKWLSINNDSSGYQKVALYTNGVRKDKGIHILVAITYLDKPKTGQNQVNHKDLDKTNNHISNLEWVTSRENRVHYVRANPEFGQLKIYKRMNRWQAYVCRNEESYYLGSFLTEEEAKGVTIPTKL